MIMLFIGSDYTVSIVVFFLRTLWIIRTIIRLIRCNCIYAPTDRSYKRFAESIVYSTINPAVLAAPPLFKLLI